MVSTLDYRDVERRDVFAAYLASGIATEAERKSLRRVSPEEMWDDTLEYLLDVLEINEWDRGYSSVTERLDELAMNSLSHVKAFHACRVVSESSYRSRGIEPLSHALLLEKANEAFGSYVDSSVIRDAVDTLMADLPFFERKVFLFLEDVSPTERRVCGWLRRGSETIGELSHKLGVREEFVAAPLGTPTLIECNIPIGEIPKSDRIEIWRELITWRFKTDAGGDPPGIASRGSVTTNERIRPSHIVAFHALNL